MKLDYFEVAKKICGRGWFSAPMIAREFNTSEPSSRKIIDEIIKNKNIYSMTKKHNERFKVARFVKVKGFKELKMTCAVDLYNYAIYRIGNFKYKNKCM